jgi:hypothetical protein
MDKWAAALTAFGGLAAIGGLIDLAMYKSEKAKLKALLEHWWLRFTYLRWSNFGRAEAELAVQILDRWAGPRLWSWKRWRFSTVVSLLTLVFAIIWTLVRSALPQPSDRFLLEYTMPLLVVIPSIVAFALSLSVTRMIAVKAAQLCKSRLASVTVFTALLSLHVLLLLYWSALVLVLEFLAMGLALYLVDQVVKITTGPPTTFYEWFGIVVTLLKGAVPQFESGRMHLPKSWHFLFSFQPIGEFAEIATYSFKMAMDIVANGLRILLALAFLSSFVFRPLIQVPVTRLWYGAIDSEKPTFTMLFGAVGAIIAAGQVLAK